MLVNLIEKRDSPAKQITFTQIINIGLSRKKMNEKNE